MLSISHCQSMGSVGSPARNPWRCSPSHGCGLRVLLIFSRYLCYGSLFGSLFPMPLSFPALPFANARLRFDSLDAHAASLSLWRLQSTVLCFHSNQEGTGERGASGRVKGSCGCGMSWSETRGLCLGEHAGSPGLEGCGFGVATLVWGSARFLVGVTACTSLHKSRILDLWDSGTTVGCPILLGCRAILVSGSWIMYPDASYGK